MNWKKETIQRLANYPQALCSLQLLPREIRRAENDLASMGSAPLAHTRGPKGRGDQRLICQLERIDRLKDRLTEAESWVADTNTALGSLPAADRRLLELLYLTARPMGVDRICAAMGLERSSLYRRRDRALEKMAAALYGPDMASGS